jgi:hypothetical protein
MGSLSRSDHRGAAQVFQVPLKVIHKTRGENMPTSRTQKSNGNASSVTFDDVRKLALSFPGVEEGTSYGTPALRVKGKFLARLHEDGESLVVKVDYAAREVLMAADPHTFYVTGHYVCYPMMLVRLSTVRAVDLKQLIEDAWRITAPKRLVQEYQKADS